MYYYFNKNINIDHITGMRTMRDEKKYEWHKSDSYNNYMLN